MTSDGNWSTKLRKVGTLELPDHVFLDEEDECYYIGNYTPGENYNHSEVNQIVFNLKMPVAYQNEYRYRYKRREIARCGAAIGRAVNNTMATYSALVPIPPSKPCSHPEYDDRVAQIAANAHPFRKSELLTTSIVREPAHLNRQKKRSIQGVYDTLESHADRILDASTCILIDDVLTTGASFKACKRKITEMGVFERILGVFVARCAWPKLEFSTLDL